MASKKRRSKRGPKRIRGKSGRFQSRKRKAGKGKIPTKVLEKRLEKLTNVVIQRSRGSALAKSLKAVKGGRTKSYFGKKHR